MKIIKRGTPIYIPTMPRYSYEFHAYASC
jgi:hypothetical protein